MNPSAQGKPDSHRASPGRGGPLVGAYFWVPRPGPDGPVWDLTTCHNLGLWDGVSHREFWPHILFVLAAHWGKDPVALKRALRNHHNGLPRGRIARPESVYLLIHGDDAPVSRWMRLVKTRFQLIGVKVTPDFTEHEKMIGDDPQAVQAALGVTLHLKTTA